MSEPAAAAAPPARPPWATLRIQLGGAVDFAAAAALVPYARALGVSHLYLSPVLEAAPGSAHGYDVVRHDAVRAELGGEDGLRALARAARAADLGLVLDVVPNHMGVDRPRANPWWWDVLENGNCSPHARWFDVDWDPVKPELSGRVLLPVLGDPYGDVLERGELALAFADGAFVVRYWERELPLNPRRAPEVLRVGLDALVAELGDGDSDLRELLSVSTALANLPSRLEADPARIAERQREKEVARDRLARLVERAPRIRRHVDDAVRALNGAPGDPASFDRLHALLEGQAYRLAYWRTAFHEINYRRFFDVNGLASVRMEDAEVFAAAHALLVRLARDGVWDGLRLDHVDGLADPGEYLDRLAAALREAGAPPAWIVGEKVLTRDERLPEDWAMHGTTGYDFLNDLAGLFVDGAAAGELHRLYRRFTRREGAFDEVAHASKRVVMTSTLASELNLLAHALNRISEGHRASRDFTLNSLHEMLREVVASFPVYRTYVVRDGHRDEDRARLEEAVADALRRNPAMDASIFAFFLDVMLDRPRPGVPDAVREASREFARKFQQYTGPVEAKGVEDTAFYRHVVLLALNEVGGDPRRFGRDASSFHAANAERRARWPLAMLATATHDTKRGEDARMRIAAISEMPRAWGRAVQRWSRLTASNRTRVDDEWAPDRGDEYLFYQALLGAWPCDGLDPDALCARVAAYMRKAIREAKLHTSWIHANEDYEAAVQRFVEGALTGRRAARFIEAFDPFARSAAALGAVSSLAAVVLKCASVGVPDVYQGADGWDLSLVDPDNRRPVDFAARRATLDALEPALDPAAAPADRAAHARACLAAWPDGRVKTLVTAAALRARRDDPALFLDGDYAPLETGGVHAARIVAFARRHAGRAAIAVAPRLVAAIAGGAAPLGPAWWDTRIALPAELARATWRDAMTGAIVRATGDPPGLDVAAVLAELPVALLVAVPDGA